jgi:PKHD-type hydroxylase
LSLARSPRERDNPAMDSPGLYLHVPSLVTREELESLLARAREAEFEDGRTTATLGAKEVKRNLQMVKARSADVIAFENLLLNAINRHPLVSAVVMPRQVHPPMINRYDAGMSYGWHVDSPLMGMPPVRTDVAMTLFLSHPESYDGGALTIETPAGPVAYRLPAGDAIFYPADRNHCVTPVTRGTRLCAVTWIQSVIRDPSKREVVFMTNQLYSMLSARDLRSPEAQLAMGLYSRLVRMWEE